MLKKYKVKQWIKAIMPKKQKQQKQYKIEVQKFQIYNYQEQQWTQAQAQIINQLINMYNLIKITKHINIQEYLTLKQINQIICLQVIEKSQIKKCLLGGLSFYNQKIQKKILTKQLPYQYYSVRALLWKISLGYLPKNNKSKWVSMMENNLRKYKMYVKQYIIQKVQRKKGAFVQFKKQISQEQSKKKDHPLNFSNQSKWKNYFEDVQLWKVIEKDTKRTRKDCKFFQEYYQYNLEGQNTYLLPSQITYTQIKNSTYTDSLTRILFIYLKNHSQQVYCQGMNQFVALIYYCITNKNSEYFRRVSQSNTYYLFKLLMGKLPKKHFQKGQQYADKFIQILKKVDLRLYEQIQKQDKNGIYCLKAVTVKWFLTGFLTQFTIDKCLLLWDGVITFPLQDHLLDYFYYIGLAIVHLNRQKIIDNQNIISIFSQLNSFKSQQIIQKANSLYKLFPTLLH